jgi:DNA-binding NarL/FixJ family response regulator
VIVVDPEVPDGGIKLVGDLVQARPGCGILVLTRSTDGSGVGHALQAGARGYLQKDCEPEALFEAIERVHRGELVVAPALREAVVQDLGTGPSRRSGPASLTLREIEVLRLVAQGHTNQEMARELVITQHTVKAHLAKMLGKLGLDNRVQLAAYATQHGIASPNNYPA